MSMLEKDEMFVDTNSQFVNWDNVGEGSSIIGIFQGFAEGKYGKFCNFLDEENGALMGVSAGAVKYAAENGRFMIGDRVRLTYKGKQKSPKFKKEFYVIDVAVDQVYRKKNLGTTPVAAPVATEKFETFEV